MKFSSDSKHLIISFGMDRDYEIQIITVDANGVFGEASFSNNDI